MAKIIFWTSLFIIFYTYFGYMILCSLLSKLFGKKVRKKDIFPSLSIIVPCYNEETVIRKKLENLTSLEYPEDKLQIIIASESNDKTNNIVSEFKAKGVELYTYEERQGKSLMLYKTVPKSRGEIVVFSDANAIYKKDALKKLASNFHDERIGAVSGILIIDNPKRSNISNGEYIYKKYETLLRGSNSLLGCVLNSDGSIFAIRKKLYNPISPERGDDFELVIRILINGYRSVLESEAISYEHASVTAKAETDRKIRIVSWFLKSSIILMKEMFLKFRFGLIFQIISHKLLRWFSPYFFIAIFISNFILLRENPFYLSAFIFQISILLNGMLGYYISKTKKKKTPLILGISHYFIMFNYGFIIGTIKGLIPSKTSSYWEKVRA